MFDSQNGFGVEWYLMFQLPALWRAGSDGSQAATLLKK